MTATRNGHAETGSGRVRPLPRPGRITWMNTVKQANLVVVLVVGVGVLTSACGGDGSDGAVRSPTPTPRRLEAVPAPDPTTPDGVAVAAVKEIYTWYPVTEAQGGSLARARKWLGPSLIRTLDTPAGAAETPKPTLRWADWGKAGARVEAFTFASGEKAPSAGDPDHEQYKIGIEQTAVYPDGRREPLAPATVIATVVRTPDGWRLDGFR
ncbi:hypothetical protein [Nocardia sp. BMG51109]|uniref:hypothetical protein n=1 Tax=Nocardia sp. BMG51109 TaxID=1056816 RepID=UPI0004649495|nr:hypothetical protein [Nocardia sp. BMG51109]